MYRIQTQLFILTVLITSALSADIYWKSTGNGDWLTLTNWFNLVGGSLVPSLSLPLAGDNVFITNEGTYNVTYSLTSLLAFGALTVGSSTNTGKQTVIFKNAYQLSGACTVEKSGTIQVESTLQGSANVDIKAGGSLVLNGGTIKTTAANTFSVAGSVAVTASSNIEGRVVQILGTASQVSVNAGASLNLVSSATMKFSGSSTLVLQGDLNINSGSSLTVDASASLTQSGSGSVKDGSTAGSVFNFGTYEISASSGIVSSVRTSFENQGRVTTSGSGTVILSGSFSQKTNTSFLVVNSNLNVTNNLLVVANGTLMGSGTIGASVSVSGVINVGNSPGKHIVNGDLTCDERCVLQIEIGGKGSSEFDQLVVLGTITIKGWVNFKCIDPYSATFDDSFTYLYYNKINYSPFLNFITGNGFAFKVPSITIGTSSTSMRIARVSSSSAFGLGVGAIFVLVMFFI